MLTTAIFLVCLMVAPQANGQQGEPLTNSDLLKINGSFAAPSEHKDNELLYKGKLTEVVEKVRSYEGRSIELVAGVERVREDGIEVTFFPKARYSWFHPMLAFVKPAEVDNFDFAATRPNRFQQLDEASLAEIRARDLKIGDHVPLSLAKTLQRGDRLRVTGKLAEIQVAQTYSGSADVWRTGSKEPDPSGCGRLRHRLD